MPTAKTLLRIVTDETLLESARHGTPAFPFQYYYDNIWDYDFHCADWHWHPELELVYVQSGVAVCYIGEEKLKLSPGFGLLINSRAIHRFEAESDTIVPNAVFSPFLLASEESLLYRKYMAPFLNCGAAYVVFDPDEPWQAACIRYMREMFRLQDREEADELGTVCYLLSFWNEMVRHVPAMDAPQKKTPDRSNQARLQIMMQYIQEHYRENVHLEEIAGAVYIGKSTALQIFHQGIHVSPISYLIQYRLRKAAALLTDTKKKVAVIAEETGFQNAGYFCRKFKALYGISPQEYRRSKVSS